MKTCVMVYGRFNPIHKGHGFMLSAGMGLLNQIDNSDFKIFMSSTVDERNPMPFGFKCEMIHDYYPMCTQFIQCKQDSTLFGVLEQLDEEYDNIILLCGSDRYEHYNRVLNKYNHELYNFNDINVYCCGDKRESCPYSSTAMREAIRNNDYKSFCTFVPFRTEEINLKHFKLLKEFIDIQDSHAIQSK